MRRTGAAFVLSLGICGIAVPPATAGLFSNRSDSSIAAMLRLVPEDSWGPESGGFYAVDLAGLRDELGLEWPTAWPGPDDAEMRQQIVGITAKFALQPMALYMLAVAEPKQDPLARIGLSTLRLDGSIDVGFFIPQATATYLVGEDLVDEATVSAALGTQPAAGDGLSAWVVGPEIDLPHRDDMRLVADGTDTAIFQDASQDIGALLVRDAALADKPAISTLLAAVEGPGRENGTLVALWAAHPAMLSRLPDYPEGGWPADASLPPYDLFAAGLRYEDGAAVGSLVLVYNDVIAAERAEMALTQRLPEIVRRFQVENVQTAIVAGEGTWRAVLVESRDAVSTENRRQPGMFLAASMQFLLLDFGMILPQR